MRSVDTAVLGTDVWGLHLASRLNDSPGTTALIGPLHSRGDYEDYLTQLSSGSNIINDTRIPALDRLVDDLVIPDAKIFDLELTEGGVHLALDDDGDLHTIRARELIVTAPAGVDIVEDAAPLPGADSAVSGLVIDRFEIEFQGTTKQRTSNHEQLTYFHSGFRTTDDGQTPVDNLFVMGPAQHGPLPPLPTTVPDTLASNTANPETTGSPTDFDRQDESMPEGFVDTKTNRLRELMNQVIQRDTDRDTEPLVQEIEGLTGEIDSYSRFRTEPELLRLRWKMLTAMNLVRPFLLESRSSVG